MRFEVWAEIAPSRSQLRVLHAARRVRGLADAIDVPEAPLGKPSAHAVAVAYLASREALAPAVANIRLYDVNANGLLSLLGAAQLLGLRGVVLLRGDPPVYGRKVEDVGTEDAVMLARKSRLRIELGAILSLAKPAELLARRLSLPVDFFLATRLQKPSQLGGVVQEARRKGKKIIPYVVVAYPDEAKTIYEMLSGHQPVYEPSELYKLVPQIAGLADGVLISSPLSEKALIDALKAAREARSELVFKVGVELD